MDWTKCTVVEIIPGKVSGQPIIKGSRVRSDDLVVNRVMGEAWLSQNFGVSREAVREVLAFYDRHKRPGAP